MKNEHVISRLKSLLADLNNIADATSLNASAVKGTARANFINKFLIKSLPTKLRIETSGQVTDSFNNITGEVDIIIENGHFPSLHLPTIDGTRLYFAEGTAAIIEVKSDLSGQWDEVITTGQKINQITRKFKGFSTPGITQLPFEISDPEGRLPKLETPKYITDIAYYVVGYRGWQKIETLNDKLIHSGINIAGILQLDNGFFVCNNGFKTGYSIGEQSLLYFLEAINESSNVIHSAGADLSQYLQE